jgi:DNA-binding beta-propeller fold protein YncE
MRLLIFLAAAELAWAQAPFRLERTIALPGVEGRFDHFAVDLAGKRLFVAALGNNTLEVLDIAAGKLVRSVPGMHEPQGVAFVPDAGKIYVANGQDGKLHALDAATLKPAGEVEFGDDADNVRYDAARNQIWVGYGDGAVGAMDVAGMKRAGDIRVDAHPESFQLEKGGTRIFVNVPNAGEIEVLDRAKKTVVAKWPVKAAAANFPMALDEAGGRLFTGCRKPAKVLVLDMGSGKMVAQFPCPGDTDDLFFDGAHKRLYVAGGEGFVEAFEQKSPDEYRSLGRVATAPGARTAFYIPELSLLFVAAPHRGAQGAKIRAYRLE